MATATISDQSKSLVVITWDGKSKPMSHVLFDADPHFDLLLFNYSGKEVVEKMPPNCQYISAATENKGQIFEHIYLYLKEKEKKYHYIGILDDDLFCSIIDLNKLLFIANLENLAVFQPSISHDSYFDHRQFIHKPGMVFQTVDWVEIMAPFYRMEIFNAAYPYFKHTISGQGIDVYLVPTLQRMMQLTKTAVVHAVQIKHCRPIRSGKRIYSNKKNNLEEIRLIQKMSKELVSENDPALFEAYFLKRILNKTYSNKVTIFSKLLRVNTMIKNLYIQIVNASYR